jgi:hypothetical protein
MKTLSQNLIFSVLALSAMVACGKKNDGGSAPAQYPACQMGQYTQPGQLCHNGQLIPAQACTTATVPQAGYGCMNGYLVPLNSGSVGNLMSNVQFQNSFLQGVINISGQGSTMEWGNSQAASFYSGPAEISGTVQVMSQLSCMGGMMLMPGSYTAIGIGTYGVSGYGMYAVGVLSNFTLNLAGPMPLQIQIYNAELTSSSGLNNSAGGARLGIMAATLSVNGQPCGSLTTY